MLTVNLDILVNKHSSFYNEIIFDYVRGIKNHRLLNCSRLGKCQYINHSGSNNADSLAFSHSNILVGDFPFHLF